VGWGTGEALVLTFETISKLFFRVAFNNIFSKMCVFKSLTGYTGDGYENRKSYVLMIMKSKAMQSVCCLF
jgi:hypothetical protein